MSLRTIASAAQLKPWLPSDYSATGWTDEQIDALLTATPPADPRMIAAEIWEEYAGTLTEETGEARPVTRVDNLDISVEYGTATTPYEWAMKQARRHRSRSKVKSISLTSPRVESDPAEGLIEKAPPDPKTTTSGPEGQR